MKPIDVKSNSYAEYNVDFNAKDPKFKIGDHVRISKYKNIFAKVYAPNWSEEVFVISKIKNIVPWTYGTKYSRIDQVKVFKGCLPQILLGLILNTLSHMVLMILMVKKLLELFI